MSASDTVDVVVTVNPAPNAVIETDTTSGQGPLLVNFDGTDSSDDGSIVSYLWDFGGGQTSTDAEPSFTFTTVGTHPVTLTVTDNEGASDTESVNIIVDPVPNQTPNAVAAATTADHGQGARWRCRSPRPVRMIPTATIESYEWSFSDGGSSTDAEPDPHLHHAGHLHGDADRHRRRRRHRLRDGDRHRGRAEPGARPRPPVRPR